MGKVSRTPWLVDDMVLRWRSAVRGRLPPCTHSAQKRGWQTRQPILKTLDKLNGRRYASTSRIPALRRPTATRVRDAAIGTTIGITLVLAYLYITDTRAGVHRLAPILVRTLYPDAEDAHEAGVHLLKELYRFNAHPRERGSHDIRDLETEVFGHSLSNSLGISSGLDKHGEIPSQLLALGPAGLYTSERIPSKSF